MSGEVKKSIYGKDKLNEMVEVFIHQLEQGVPCWVKPYSGGGQWRIPQNYLTRRNYRGLNVLHLWGVMEENGYESPYFLSYKQARQMNAHVKKGAKGHQIIFWEMKERKEAEANEETGEISHYWFTRVYTVFHVSQVEGLNVPEVEKELPAAFNYKHADEFVRRTGIRCLIRAGAVPSYSVSKDLIIMPPLREFNSQEEYIQAKLHELGHASGAKERLNRLEQCKFGDQIYAFEELTVELCAAFLGAHLGVPIRKVQHAEYLKHWIDALRAKPQILWSASTKAQSAFDYLLRLGGEEVPFEQVPMAVNQ